MPSSGATLAPHCRTAPVQVRISHDEKEDARSVSCPIHRDLVHVPCRRRALPAPCMTSRGMLWNVPPALAPPSSWASATENTLGSFRRAIADGADILETDLHLTADGVFVCIHDGTVDRTTDGSGAVAEMSLKEIKRLSASCGREEFVAERVPTLAELATMLPSDVALALELKTDRFLEPEVCRQLVNQLRAADVLARSVVLSFHEGRIRAVRAVEPEIPIGGLTVRRGGALPGGGEAGAPP